MNKAHFDKYVVELTKDIVVAKMGNSAVITNEETGKQVADFFNAIFNSLHEELSKTELLDQ